MVRHEWSSVSQGVRDNYIESVLCLATKPSRIGLNSTLYDDFPWIHNQLASESKSPTSPPRKARTDRLFFSTAVHAVAAFLPWHRYFVHIYEKALQECGYEGNALYFDWTLVSDSPSTAAIWSPKTGMGGNGSPDTSCLIDGPFTTLKPAYYLDLPDPPRCIQRDWNDGSDRVGTQPLVVGAMMGEHYSPNVIARIMEQGARFENFSIALEAEPHNVFHASVGGDMGPDTSPNDPMFFAYHTFIDQLWWRWQNVAPENRTLDYSGIGGSTRNPDPPVTASLKDKMRFLGLAPDVTVRDAMSTVEGDLCYRY
ncbi:monooxygenase [Phlyctema vagabunda]|uniref:Monooxygenase n=1 Tax=Phlyctema vagabunda TaxID=108571 RepID=A0ABR4P8H6_9HELO